MNGSVTLQCQPELLRQWAIDVAKNPAAFATLVAMSPEYLAMLVHDAAEAAWMGRSLDALMRRCREDRHQVTYQDLVELQSAQAPSRRCRGCDLPNGCPEYCRCELAAEPQ
jgi:hypothetical protein